MPGVRQIILETLSLRGPLGIEEIAQATNLSKMAARYHMHLLEQDGLVQPCGSATRRSVGRPKLCYALTERAHEWLPKRYDAFATVLLDEVTRTLGTEKVRGLLRQAGRRAAEATPLLPKSAGIERRMKRLVKFLSLRGYRASWDQTDEAVDLLLHDCPYFQVALTHPLVCEMDQALMGAVLGLPLTMKTCLAARDADCHFVVEN
jgi:DeoR family suf operon transcriptional repressor